MEFFMRNIPTDLDKFQVKAILAQHLHGPDFYNSQQNFDVHLFQPRESDRTGVVMIPRIDIGKKFWNVYGASRPQQLMFFDRNRIYFSKSTRPAPDPEIVHAVALAPWQDPTWERERSERERDLDELRVTLASIQFGWMCRDDVFSIESEARQIAILCFNEKRRELHVTVSEEYDSPTEYLIAMRQSSISTISCHFSQLDGQVIFLQLEVLPSFFNRVCVCDFDKPEPYQRLTTFPLVDNPAAIPYTAFALRLVLLAPRGVEKFSTIAGLSGLHDIVKSFHVNVARRNLFSQNSLLNMSMSIRRINSWQVAFQLEALVRNLYADPREIDSLALEVKELIKSHGNPFTAKLLKDFGPRAKHFLKTSRLSSLKSEFISFVQEFRSRGDLEPDAPNNINFYSSLHVTVTPTSMYLDGPFIEKSNRVIRRYTPANQQNFIRVEFRDENNLLYRHDKDIDSAKFVNAWIGPIMRDGLVIAGRKFRFLAYSQSALKEHSVWFVKTFNDPKYGIVTAEKIIQSLGTFRGLEYDLRLEYCPARYGARISQAFSATDAAVVDVDEILIRDDITTPDGKYTFTDGCGGMSEDIARGIWSLVGKGRDPNDFPHAYQIRFQGSKGMISVDHTLNGSNALSLRRSMIKFDAPSSTEIEISRAIDRPTPYYLNRPLIMILEGLGIPYQVFQDFQDHAIRETQAATQRLSAAAHLLQIHGLGQSFRLPSTLLSIAKLGLDFLAQGSFFDLLFRIAVYHVLRDLKYRARIPIPNAWNLVGVADTHRYLRENEVFVCISHRERGVFYLEGPVLISRSPTIHPGDVQLAYAIGAPSKESCFATESLPNTIVFSVRGERPLPTCLGGGDLDGDTYNIIPLTDHPYFTPKYIYEPAEYPPPLKEYVDWSCTMADVANFVMKYIVSDVLGLVATNWLILADQSNDIQDPKCMVLAKLHSDAVDYPKTGRQVDINEIPKPKLLKPDWCAPETIDNLPNQDGKYYQSQTALGKLTRQIDLKAHEPSFPRRYGATSANTIDSITNGLSSIGLTDTALQAIQTAVAPRVVARLSVIAPANPIISEAIMYQFKVLTDELLSISSRYSLSRHRHKPLIEEELLIGSITQRTSQPTLRKEKMIKIKDATEIVFRRVRKALEGDDKRTSKEYLRYSWSAWMFSLREMSKKTFGAQSFWWIAAGAVFDAMKKIDDDMKKIDDEVNSRYFPRDRMI